MTELERKRELLKRLEKRFPYLEHPAGAEKHLTKLRVLIRELEKKVK